MVSFFCALLFGGGWSIITLSKNMKQWSGKQYLSMKKYNRTSDNDINEAVLWEKLGSDESFRIIGAKINI